MLSRSSGNSANGSWHEPAQNPSTDRLTPSAARDQGRATSESEGGDFEDIDGDDDSDNEDQGSSPAPTPDGDEDDEDDDEEEEPADEDDESPFRFLQNFDPSLFSTFDTSWPSHGLHQSLQAGATPAAHKPQGPAQQPPTSNNDAEFYSNMIQMLTHVLGSSNPVQWYNQATPGSQLAPSPFTLPQSSPAPTPGQTPLSRHASQDSRAKASGSRNAVAKKPSRLPGISDLQPLIHALISRLGGDHLSPRHPVGEQDLTALLQSLMEQQQRQQAGTQFRQPDYADGDMLSVQTPTGDLSRRSSHRQSFAQGTMQPMHFADLVFEDEDEDDPDFNPDLNPHLPLPSAWSLAVQDVVGSKESRAAAAAVAASTSNTPAARTPSGARHAEAESGKGPVITSTQGALRDPYSSDEPASKRQRTETPLEDTWQQEDSENIPIPVFSPSGRPVRSTRIRQQSPSGVSMRRDTIHLPTSQTELQRSPSRLAESRPASGNISAQTNTFAQRSSSERSLEPHTRPAPIELHGERDAPRRRGRKPILEEGEAQRRRAQRNIEYQRNRRQMKKAEVTEQSETVMELRAEVKVLRAEMGRLREENATLRAQREIGEMQQASRYRDVRHDRDEASASPWSAFESPTTDSQSDQRYAANAAAVSWQASLSSDRRRNGSRQLPSMGTSYRSRVDRFA